MKEKLIQLFSQRLILPTWEALVWRDIIDAVASATDAQRAAIVAASRSQDATRLGAALLDILSPNVRTRAAGEAAKMLAGDTVSVADLLKLYSRELP